MYKLFLDIGNSYLKWASVIDGDYQCFEPLVMTEVLKDELAAFKAQGVPDEVYISNVGKADAVDALKLLIQEQFQVFPIVLSTQKQCCGLVNGYDDFSQLGVDRWFAMQGALGIYKEPCLIIDAGTALTIDAVIESQHKGGFIVPGLATMRQSLSLSTADLADYSERAISEDNESPFEGLATNTHSAILGGTLYMTAAFLNQLIVDLNAQFATQFKLVLTGGEAVQFGNLLDYDFDYVPDLVLQGMVNVEESVKKV
ncbi:type III pantothenate kinase [Thiomicrorhabdus sediminis]|uniref:Type III pantothenate kinase n=1 Tax=Thiomicrorhabdus sediminis TaxID=2580412 RepID=A0A4P9K753_9GAMM|nr:type III pantothenate kinase [Thiomicrorhabdus sediminis]QCU90922.1 type III pantothenate kinase [Thiomicrorhabdus sediminis]